MNTEPLPEPENHLQAIADQQTQTLPEDPLHQIRLAYSMDFADWNNFIAIKSELIVKWKCRIILFLLSCVEGEVHQQLGPRGDVT